MPLSYWGGVRPAQILVLNGDSLTTGAGIVDPAQKWFNRLLYLVPPRSYLNFAVGGSSVTEVATAVAGMSAENKSRTQYVDLGQPDTLVPAEDSLEEYINAADTVIAAIPHNRVVLCLPAVGNYAEFYPGGSHNSVRIDAAAYIQATYPTNAFDLYTVLKDGSDGSPGDLIDVANEVSPRSLRIPDDNIHWNGTTGSVCVANGTAAFIASRGW